MSGSVGRSWRVPPRGVAIAVILLMLVIAMGVTAAAGLLTQQNYVNAQSRERLLKVKYAISAGLQTAMAKLQEDPLWRPKKDSPYKEYLVAEEGIGFQLWFDGVNLDSDTAVVGESGIELQRGQASVQVEALIDGAAVKGGFGGFQAQVLLVKPPVEFEHAFFRSGGGGTAYLPNGPSSLVCSYHSEAGTPPAITASGIIPPENRRASVRAMSDLSLGATDIYGQVFLPPGRELTVGGAHLEKPLVELDEGHVPRVIVPPPGWDENPIGVGPLTPGVPKYLPPGIYKQIYADPGVIIELERGGVYGFCGSMELEENSEIRLVGDPTAGPTSIYLHTFATGINTKINMPPPGESPRPADLQMYGLPYYDCNSTDFHFEEDSQSALLASQEQGELYLEDGATLYGSFIAGAIYTNGSAVIHYDMALRDGVEVEADTEWVLVSQALK